MPFSYESINGNVLDMSGRIVKTVKQTNKVDVSNLSNGMYVLDLIIDSKPFQQKFIVSKN